MCRYTASYVRYSVLFRKVLSGRYRYHLMRRGRLTSRLVFWQIGCFLACVLVFLVDHINKMEISRSGCLINSLPKNGKDPG